MRYMVFYLIIFCLWADIAYCASDDKDPGNSESAQAVGEAFVTEENNNKPEIIWCFSATRDELESLECAISSGLITHISIGIGGRVTENRLHDSKMNLKIRRAIEMAKYHEKKVIIIRYLWPTYPHKNVKGEDLFEPDYYRNEIINLREVAKEFGVGYIGFDVESYNENSPMGKYLRWKSKYKLSKEEIQALQKVIGQTVQNYGQVDYVYPAGSIRKHHPYNILSNLGKNRIAERTYYDDERYLSFDYPYEIFGAYVNTVRENEKNSSKPYYLVNALFEKSERWSGKKGVFLYPKEGKALEVAKSLKLYADSLRSLEKVDK